MAETKEKILTLNNVKGYLETVTNLAVLLVALVFLAGFAWSFFVPKTKVRPQIRPEIGLRKGNVLHQPAGIDYNAAPQTLLLLMNTECHYCEVSLPFYKKLATSSSIVNNTKMVALFPNPQTKVGDYAQKNELNFQTISSPDFQLLKMLGTPTLILTNSKGEILDFWIGKLSAESEQEVLKALGVS